MKQELYSQINNGQRHRALQKVDVTCPPLFDTYISKQIQFKVWNMFSTVGEKESTMETLFSAILEVLNNSDIC